MILTYHILFIALSLGTLCGLLLLVDGYESTCIGPLQEGLLYNVDRYTAQEVGLPGQPDSDELLSDAICCDVEYRNYAEPNGFFKFPDISLFKKVTNINAVSLYFFVRSAIYIDCSI